MKPIAMHTLIKDSGVGFGTSGMRGLVSALTDPLCYAYTCAFLQVVAGESETIVLGHDLRPSSPRMASACAAAMRDMGYAVIYAGALPTPALAYYASQIGAPALIVTGSHIPFDRNGLKFYRTTGEISKLDEALMQEAAVHLPKVVDSTPLPTPDPRARASYVQRYVGFFGADALKCLQVAVYEHSSVARDVLPDILTGLGAKVISLGRTDTFVPIDTEAVRTEDLVQARAWALEHPFDAILSTDGDADRPLIGDAQGTWLRGDAVGLLCAQYLQAQVVVTPVSSNTAVEACGQFKQVVRTRIGSPYVIAAMEAAISAQDAIVVGYEANGGFLLGSAITHDGQTLRALPTRDAVLPMLAILRMARLRACPVSALVEALPARYTASDRLAHYSQERSRQLIEALQQDSQAASQMLAPTSGAVVHMSQIDGLRVTFANGDIVHLRASGNAPELRCYAEAATQAQAERLCTTCLQRLHPPDTHPSSAD